LGKLIGEDGRKPKNIPRVFCINITINDVDRTIGLHGLELYKLEEAILANKVAIKKMCFHTLFVKMSHGM
jgi:hypothetical protein